jgi:hypothetical protein
MAKSPARTVTLVVGTGGLHDRLFVDDLDVSNLVTSWRLVRSGDGARGLSVNFIKAEIQVDHGNPGQ